MKIAITGTRGLVGRHLAKTLLDEGHRVTILGGNPEGCADGIRRHPNLSCHAVGESGGEALQKGLAGCDALAHCAAFPWQGKGNQGTINYPAAKTRLLMEAARRAGVQRVALAGFLRARPGCRIPWLENLWEAEEITRGAGMEHLVVKCGLVYGPGDDFVTPLAHGLAAWPLVVLPGNSGLPVRPVAVEEVTRLFRSFLVERRPRWRTVALTGPETVILREAVERVAAAAGLRVTCLELPAGIRHTTAWIAEKVFRNPWVTPARLRVFAEPLDSPLPYGASPPANLRPGIAFTAETLRKALPSEAVRETTGFHEPRPYRR